MAVRFWALLSRPSYWLYERRLPSGYGWISDRYGRVLLRQSMRKRGVR